MTGRYWLISRWLLLLTVVGSMGCDLDDRVAPKAPPGVESREWLRPLFPKIEGLQATIESSRMLVHRLDDERVGSMQFAEWLYLVPDGAAVDLDGLDFGGSDPLAESTRDVMNHTLRGTGWSIGEVLEGHHVSVDVAGAQYSIDDVRTASGRFLHITCIR